MGFLLLAKLTFPLLLPAEFLGGGIFLGAGRSGDRGEDERDDGLQDALRRADESVGERGRCRHVKEI